MAIYTKRRVVLVQSALLAVAFAFQLIAVLTVPVTKSLSLCTYNGLKFGVFGFCDDVGECTPVSVGYPSAKFDDVRGFSLPSNARRSISKLLIVHVLAAAFSLIMVVLNLLTLHKRFASSSRFLLSVLIWTVPTFLLSLLSFLVDILLFVPHMDWCGWTVLASTVLIVISGTTTCVTRRTVSSRKSHLKHLRGEGDMYSLVGSISSTSSLIERQESKQTTEDSVFNTPQRQTSTGFSFGRQYAQLEQQSPLLIQRAATRHTETAKLGPYTPVHDVHDDDLAFPRPSASPRRDGSPGRAPNNDTFDDLYGAVYQDSETGTAVPTLKDSVPELVPPPLSNPYEEEEVRRMPTVVHNNRQSMLTGPRELHTPSAASSVYDLSRNPTMKHTEVPNLKPLGPRPLPSEANTHEEAVLGRDYADDEPLAAGVAKSLQAPSSQFLDHESLDVSQEDLAKYTSSASLVESNFTSISQRPINPRYFEMERIANLKSEESKRHVYNQRVPTPYREKRQPNAPSSPRNEAEVFDNSKFTRRARDIPSNNTSKEFL